MYEFEAIGGAGSELMLMKTNEGVGKNTIVPFRPHFSFCRFTSSSESPVLSLTQK